MRIANLVVVIITAGLAMSLQAQQAPAPAGRGVPAK